MSEQDERVGSPKGAGGREPDLGAPAEDDVDLSASPGTEAHDRAQEAVMREGAAAAATESPGPAFGDGGEADAADDDSEGPSPR